MHPGRSSFIPCPIGGDSSRSGCKRPRMDRETSAIQNQSARVTRKMEADQAHHYTGQHDRTPSDRLKAGRDTFTTGYPTAHRLEVDVA